MRNVTNSRDPRALPQFHVRNYSTGNAYIKADGFIWEVTFSFCWNRRGCLTYRRTCWHGTIFYLTWLVTFLKI